MTDGLILGIVGLYFVLLVVIARLTSGKGENSSFFTGDKSSKWYLVAFGMIGASLSGVTFVSATGQVDGAGFSYMQMVFGYLIGYILVAYVLMPVYYRMNVTSIYEYLGDRFGFYSYKTGAFYFLISRFFGASIRLLLVARILQYFVMDDMGVDFWVTVTISVLLIWLYTNRGGIKTIVYTDTLQTFCMITAAVVAFIGIANAMDTSFVGLGQKVMDDEHSKIWVTDVMSGGHWLKMILAGMLVTFCMTGLDQDMMQKNLSCKNIKEAQKNMMSFSVVLVAVNFFFLLLGGALMLYGKHKGIDIPLTESGTYKPDMVFPTIALESDLGVVVGVFFLLGLIAAAYSSADSALTSLTTSICVDFLDVKKKDQKDAKRLRKLAHISSSLIMIVLAVVLHENLDQDALNNIFLFAALTYGPLLGLFVFGLVSKRQIENDIWVIPICVLAPIVSWVVYTYIPEWTGGFKIGNELLGLNGLLTILGLYVISKSQPSTHAVR